MAVIDLAMGPAEAFGPLKAVLASISIFYTNYQVRFFRVLRGPPLTIASPEHCRRQGQDRNAILTHYYPGGDFQEPRKW